MPLYDPDPDDPMTLHGIVVPTEDPQVDREMAIAFIEEYLRMGYGPDRVLSMFKIPEYVGPYRAYQALGEDALIGLIEQSASLWGGRREGGVLVRDAEGQVTPERDGVAAGARRNEMSNTHHGCTSNAQSPIEVLKEEHQVIERVLDAMERMLGACRVEAAFMTKAIDFFRNFADQCHHAKEENIFFPAIERAGIPRDGGPIGCMLREHDEGRGLIRIMADNLQGAARNDAAAADRFASATHAYIVLIREHINKENNVLFVMAEHVLDAESRISVRSQFEEAELSGGGHEHHNRYLALADELSNWKFPLSAPRD